MSSLALSDAAVAFASAFAVFLLFQQKAFASAHQTASKGALLGFLLMALAGITGTLKFGFSDAWTGVYLFFNNAATFMSPPLIGVAMILMLSDKVWSKQAWGQLIIAICLAFEVSRWYGMEGLYRDAQLAIILVVLCIQVMKCPLEPGTRGLLIASFLSFFVGALVIGNEGTLGGYLRLNLFRYFIALGNLLLGTGIFMFLRKNKHTCEHEDHAL